MAKVGRPPKFKTPKEMEPLIEGYFSDCDKAERPYTVPGIALALGFADRHSLHDYMAKDEFTATIKRARLRIEAQRAQALVTRTQGVAGLIFDLKNNFGWKDKTEHEHTGADGKDAPIEHKITVEFVGGD